MSDRYAIVNTETNVVENVILWDGDTNNWSPPEGFIALHVGPEVGIGWTHDSGVFTAPASE